MISSEEYPINARRFIASLHEEKEIRLKGGFYHLNQII
jgi:hypothetical protein